MIIIVFVFHVSAEADLAQAGAIACALQVHCACPRLMGLCLTVLANLSSVRGKPDVKLDELNDAVVHIAPGQFDFFSYPHIRVHEYIYTYI